MLGLVVNPAAGLGGPAGLGGSDGVDVQRAALARGTAPGRALARAVDALAAVAAADPRGRVLTAAGEMGEDAVRAAGLTPAVVAWPAHPTTAADTTEAVGRILAGGADLLLFAGGDGTARDVTQAMDAAGTDAAALGIPAGVKMYSPVFAVSPRAAGAIAAAWLRRPLPTRPLEVLDVDEAALRAGEIGTALYGELRVPYVPGRTQARKAPTPADERAAVRAAAAGAVARLRPGVSYLLGPGATTAEIARQLGLPASPLGVDVVQDGRLLVAAASEPELRRIAEAGPAQAVVSIVGGQGFLLGRGNQQLSAAVLAALDDDPLIVVAPEQKLIDLHGRPLLVDTGSPAMDAALAGYVRVITGTCSTAYYPVHAPQLEGVAHAS